MDQVLIARLIDAALELRAFGQHLRDLQRTGVIAESTELCEGQELCAATLREHLRLGEDVFYAERCSLAHLVALGAPQDGLLAELLERKGALCHSFAGAHDIRYKNLYRSSTSGNTTLFAVGHAWTLKQKKSQSIAVAQVSIEMVQSGAFHEALLCAAALELPILFHVELDEQHIPSVGLRQTASTLSAKLAGFGVEAHICSEQSIPLLSEKTATAIEKARRNEPQALIVETAIPESDSARSALTGALESMSARKSFAVAKREVRGLSKEVKERPPLSPVSPQWLPVLDREFDVSAFYAENIQASRASNEPIASQLNRSLKELMHEQEELVVLEKASASPRPLAAEVTKGLDEAYPTRLLIVPTTDQGLVGAGIGTGFAGFHPICELDAVSGADLAAAQLILQAARLNLAHGACPITVRLISRAGISECLECSTPSETRFLGTPGLRVLALSQRHHPKSLLRLALADDTPTIIIEHESLYSLPSPSTPPADLQIQHRGSSLNRAPNLCYLPPSGVSARATLVTFGALALNCEAAMRALFVEEEISLDYFILTQLWPLADVDPILDSVRRTGRLVVVEPGLTHYGVGAALIADIVESAPATLTMRVGQQAKAKLGPPSLREHLMPEPAEIYDALFTLINEGPS